MTWTVTIKNWERFQHYKNRKPPWIKLYRDLLDDREYRALAPSNRALLSDLWLLASEDGGTVKGSPTDIGWRLRASPVWIENGLRALQLAGFVTCPQLASKPLAERKRDATPERE